MMNFMLYYYWQCSIHAFVTAIKQMLMKSCNKYMCITPFLIVWLFPFQFRYRLKIQDFPPGTIFIPVAGPGGTRLVGDPTLPGPVNFKQYCRHMVAGGSQTTWRNKSLLTWLMWWHYLINKEFSRAYVTLQRFMLWARSFFKPIFSQIYNTYNMIMYRV